MSLYDKYQVENDIRIVVEPGLLKHHGLIYYYTKAEQIPCEPSGAEQILVVQFKECREEIKMMKCKLSDAFDVSFVMHCVQQETIQKEVIEQYVRYWVPNAERGNLSQKQLHHYLTVIVDDTKRGGNRNGMMQGGARRMLVD